jgi:hypothetical protein
MKEPNTKSDLGYEIFNCTYRINQDGFLSSEMEGKISIGKKSPDEKSDDFQITLAHFTPEKIQASGFICEADPSFEIIKVEGYQPKAFEIPKDFPVKMYYEIPGTHYILLPDGQIARLLKPCIVKGREYFNLSKSGEKIKRVSRKWILGQIASKLF